MSGEKDFKRHYSMSCEEIKRISSSADTIRITELLLLKLTRQRNLLKVLHIFANDAKDVDKPAFVSLVHAEFPVTTMIRLCI